MVKHSPTHEVREDVDVVWQIPPNPTHVLFLAHSAGGSPFSYWPSHPDVPQCFGTPEHKVLVEQALERGFAVIAASHSLVSSPSTTCDIPRCVKILKAWRSEHGLENLPLSALGTSAGGDYVSKLAAAVQMHSLIIMISKGNPEVLKSATADTYPATLWVPMIKDVETFEIVKKNLAAFREKGIPAAIVEAPPLKVHPHFFSEYIDDIDDDQSARLQSVLVNYSVLDKDYGVKKILLEYNVDPYLRKAGLLPSGDEAQRQNDEEVMKSESDDGPPSGGRERGGPSGGRARGGPSGGRGRGGPPGGRGRGGAPGGRGRGDAIGDQPPPKDPSANPLGHSVSNQIRVAEGRHTLTSRHNSEVFDWLEGKGWPNA